MIDKRQIQGEQNDPILSYVLAQEIIKARSQKWPSAEKIIDELERGFS